MRGATLALWDSQAMAAAELGGCTWGVLCDGELTEKELVGREEGPKKEE